MEVLPSAYMRGSSAFSKDERSQDEEGEGGDMAEMVYARGMFEMDGAVGSRRQQFGVSSIDWHPVFGHPVRHGGCCQPEAQP
jgi:hypothetical protein